MAEGGEVGPERPSTKNCYYGSFVVGELVTLAVLAYIMGTNEGGTKSPQFIVPIILIVFGILNNILALAGRVFDQFSLIGFANRGNSYAEGQSEESCCSCKGSFLGLVIFPLAPLWIFVTIYFIVKN